MTASPPARVPGGPRNEGELLQDRPSDHVDGLLPRALLLPGERVLYSAHPSLRRCFGWGTGILAGVLLLNFVATVIVAIVSLAPGYPGAGALGLAAATGAVGCVVWGAPLAVILWSRYRSVGALTNVRVLSLRGLGRSDFRFLALEDVANVYLAGRSSVLFVSRPPAPGGPLLVTRQVEWVRLPSAPRALAFVRETFELERTRRLSEARSAAKTSRIREQRVECLYCGNLVDLDGSDPQILRCPRCTAPLPRDAGPSVAPSPPGPSQENDDSAAVHHLRPAVHLARELVPGYRALMVTWSLGCGFLAILLLAAPAGPFTSGPLDLTAVIVLLGLALVGYVLWAYSLRKWGAVVRTVRQSFAPGSEWQRAVAYPLARRYRLMIAAFAASLLVPLSAGILGAVLVPPGQYPIGLTLQTSAIALLETLGWAGPVFAGHYLLVSSLPRVARGSEIPEIERDLRRGSRNATLGLLATWVLPFVLAYTLVVPSPNPEIGWLALLGVPGAAATAFGVDRVNRGYARWADLAERKYTAASVPTPHLGTDPSVGWGRPTAAELLPMARGHPRWVVGLLAVLGLGIVVALLSAGGVLLPWVASLDPAGSPPAYSPPPIVVVPAGTSWTIPTEHYWYESFRTNRTATLSGSFSASGTVLGYVMSSNDYGLWQSAGKVNYDQFATGNVTHGAFHVALTYPDRWYVVVLNESPSSSVYVTWSSECVATY